MLGGSLLVHKGRFHECENVLFDITITVELQVATHGGSEKTVVAEPRFRTASSSPA